MFDSDNIDGIEVLRNKIPEELQYWHKFGIIDELHYIHNVDERNGDIVSCIDMTLTDYNGSHMIKLSLFNVRGQMSFDMVNGLFSGFAIDDISDRGYEKDCSFHIYSFEQDIYYDLYCERINAEYLY